MLYTATEMLKGLFGSRSDHLWRKNAERDICFESGSSLAAAAVPPPPLLCCIGCLLCEEEEKGEVVSSTFTLFLSGVVGSSFVCSPLTVSLPSVAELCSWPSPRLTVSPPPLPAVSASALVVAEPKNRPIPAAFF